VFNLVLNDLLGAIVVQADPYNVLIRTIIELRNLLTYVEDDFIISIIGPVRYQLLDRLIQFALPLSCTP